MVVSTGKLVVRDIVQITAMESWEKKVIQLVIVHKDTSVSHRLTDKRMEHNSGEQGAHSPLLFPPAETCLHKLNKH